MYDILIERPLTHAVTEVYYLCSCALCFYTKLRRLHSVRLLHSNYSCFTLNDTILKDNFLHYMCDGVLDNRLDYTVRQKKQPPTL